MKKVRVENMKSSRGNTVPNQFYIHTDKGVFFQSYQTIIAFEDKQGKVTLDRNWDYSKTTGKYRNIFLGESKKETEKKIASGEHKLADLN